MLLLACSWQQNLDAVTNKTSGFLQMNCYIEFKKFHVNVFILFWKQVHKAFYLEVLIRKSYNYPELKCWFFFWFLRPPYRNYLLRQLYKPIIINNEDRYINVYELKTRQQYLVNLMYNSCHPDTGLHSMSTTKWSICGAYDFTCSMCKTFVFQMPGAWSLSRISLIFDETPKDQSLHIAFVEFVWVFADKSEHFELLLEHVSVEFVSFLSETFIECISFSVLLFEHSTFLESSQL